MKEQMKEIVVEETGKKESRVKVFAAKAKDTVKRNWKPFLGGAVIATLASLALASRKYRDDEGSSDPVIENEIDLWNSKIESNNDSQEEESE